MVGTDAQPGAVTFDEVYRDRYAPTVRLARMMVGSQAVAEELAQDAFVRLRGAWDRVEQPSAFLQTTVTNLCRTWLRREGRANPLVHRGEPVTLPNELDETWRAVQRLPEGYRAVLALRFYEDLSEVRIAEILGCRPSTVRSQVHRGLARLRKELS